MSPTARTKRDAELAGAGPEAATLSPEDAKALMAERARRLAEPPSSGDGTGDGLVVVKFDVGTECYGVDARHVREVLALPDVTPLCGTRDFVLGLTNLRGELLPMIDFRVLVGMPRAEAATGRRALVLGRDAAEIGVVTDAISELTVVSKRELDDLTPPLDGPAREYLRGVTKEGLMLLDGAALLDDQELLVAEREERASRPKSEGT